MIPVRKAPPPRLWVDEKASRGRVRLSHIPAPWMREGPPSAQPGKEKQGAEGVGLGKLSCSTCSRPPGADRIWK